jgi:TM2 domain-containing membrane protein YozV
MKRIILSAFLVLLVATALRYMPGLGRFALDYPSSGKVIGVPMNFVAFWLTLAVGGIIVLTQVVRKVIEMIASARAHHF